MIFKGIHKGDILGLSEKQKLEYEKTSVYEIYPEYWVIKTEKFNDKVKDKLDEWIYFLKNDEIKQSFTAKGLKEANEKLDAMKLSEKERNEYKWYVKKLNDIASRNHTIEIDTRDLLAKTVKETTEQVGFVYLEKIKETELKIINERISSVLEMHKDDVPEKMIAKYLKMTETEVAQIISDNKG